MLNSFESLLNSEIAGVKTPQLILYAGATLIVASLVSSGINFLKKKAKASKYAKASQMKRAQRDQKIKELNIPPLNISKSLEDKILDADVTTLHQMLKAGETTSEEVLLAYFKRAVTIGLDYGLITELNFEEALELARKCDKLRKQNPSACKGALFGIPISVKDAFFLKGTDATGGMACRLYNPSTDDGLLVKILKKEGAIPFIKSNVPQVMMTIDSTNHIWGSGKNPWNPKRTIGGSTGGEGALLAARCSPLGLGNDIGGSIRIPAAFNGVVGFKPTAERVTKAGTMEVAPTLNNIPNMPVATGPLAKSARDVNLMMKALLSEEAFKEAKLSEQDPYYIRVPWREDIVQEKRNGLRIGYFKSIDFFPASPANQRAVDEAVHALKKRGYEVIQVSFPNIEDVLKMYLQVMTSEGDSGFLKDALKGEPHIEAYDLLKFSTEIPNSLRGPLSKLAGLLGEKRVGEFVVNVKKRNASEFINLVAQQSKLRDEFFKVWEEKKLDALLSPSFAFPAIKEGLTKDIVLGACYTFFINVLNIPSGALPITVVKEGEDTYPKELGPHHDMMYKKTVENLEGSVGLPVGVQISTLPWQEEKCVGIMIDLEEEIQFTKKHPYPV